MVGGSRAVVALALGGWLMGSAAWAAEKTVVVRGTATPGGGFPVYGAAVADIINETDPTLAVQTRNTKGSTENVPLLEAGQLDLALVQGEVVHEALTGVGRSPANLMILAAMYSTPGMFVVRADSPYRAIADLRGKPVAFGARGSGLVILARHVLDGPLASVGSWSFIMARPTLADDVAYRLARALHRGAEALARRLPQARETTATNTIAAAPRGDLVHPGVLRYLREIGIAR